MTHIIETYPHSQDVIIPNNYFDGEPEPEFIPSDNTGDNDLLMQDVAPAVNNSQSDILAQCKERSEAETNATEQAIAKANEPRFVFKSLAEIAEQPEPGWTLHGFLPDQGLCAVYGPPACGKSFLVFDFCAHVALGKDWFKHRCYKQKPVYMLSLEGSGGLPRRIKAWKKVHRKLPDNMYISTQNFSLATDDVDHLAKIIEKGSVVVIDTLNRGMSTLDENSSQGMGTALQNLSKLQQMTESLLIVVHHCGKDNTKGLRGHSLLLGAIDQVIYVSKNAHARCFEIVKSKDGAENLKQYFKLDTIEVGMDDLDAPIMSCVISDMAEYGMDDLPKEKVKSFTDKQQNYIAMWTEAKDQHGVWLHNTDGDFLRVKKTDFRDVFYLRCVKPKDQLRGDFNRALIFLQKNNFIRGDGEDWLVSTNEA